MLKLNSVFSDKALFLHSSFLDVRGICAHSEKVSAKLIKDGEIFSCGESTSDSQGRFCVTLKTPPASFLEYTLTVRVGEEEISAERILFGELWIASGQSNMEMPNSQQPGWGDEFKNLIAQRRIRVYYPKRLAANAEYPEEPLEDFEGEWKASDEAESFLIVSALATAFSKDLFDFFRERGEEMPLGFLDVNYGGTPAAAWIPDSTFEKRPKLAYKRKDSDNWNKAGGVNFQQPSSQYNYMINPLIGVKCRGLLWYQGENDTHREQTEHIYQDLMIALRDSYKELFSCGEDERFPCICSQIYPWAYLPSIPECEAGYLNRAFSELARKYPDAFSFVPVCDLSPIWTYHLDNGPIHPAHKYELGKRFARLTWNVCYSDDDVQKGVAVLDSVTRKGNTLRLKFLSVGSGLYIKGNGIRGLYIRSEGSVYVSAKCKIVSENEMEVWNPYIEDPLYVAYAVSSGEVSTNLFAGEFPVAPFCTEFSDECGGVEIALKPWLSNEYIHDFIYEQPMTKQRKRAFSVPIFKPCPDSEICYDTVFQRSGRSLAIFGEGECFGAYITAKQYRPLDLYNYEELRMSVYNSGQLASFLNIYYKEENGDVNITRINGGVEEKLPYGWESLSFDLSKLQKGNITRLDFCFKNKEDGTPIANIDDIELIPKV